MKYAGVMEILKANEANHSFIKRYVNGAPTIIATSIRIKKSLAKRNTIPLTELPSTFLIPISRVRFETMKEARLTNPKLAINMAIPEKKLNIVDIFCSDAYRRLISSSRKEYSKGYPG